MTAKDYTPVERISPLFSSGPIAMLILEDAAVTGEVFYPLRRVAVEACRKLIELGLMEEHGADRDGLADRDVFYEITPEGKACARLARLIAFGPGH